MLSAWRWKLLQVSRRLWVRAALIGALGVVTAMLAAVAQPFIPWQVPGSIGADAVGDLLNIIASSMLAVTTFSLSVMTSAYSAATNNVTPRATKLLIEDQVTQNVLATFIGSFLFALVGIIMLKTGVYGDRGRVFLFVATIAVIALIVVTLLRWIDHLSELGRVGETTKRVEEATRDAIDARIEAPYLGATPLEAGAALPDGAITSLETGYVQHIDVDALHDCAEKAEADIYLAVLPGTFVYPRRALVRMATAKDADEKLCKAIRKCFATGTERSFDQDPRFGLAVLSEIALRALSPGINDPGTAIDVIGRQTRLLVRWAEGCLEAGETDIRFPRLHVPPLATADLFDDAFNLIARDGAGLIEVQLRLQKALQGLAELGDASFRACARTQSRLALARAQEALSSEQDKARLRDTVGDLTGA